MNHDGFSLVTVKVQDTGLLQGAEVLQPYVSATSFTTQRPVKELHGSKKVVLNPGENGTNNILIDEIRNQLLGRN